MVTVVLVRHGRSSANASGILAGRLPDVHLDDRGEAQARTVGERLKDVPLAGLVCSPLERCRETLAGIVEGRADLPDIEVDDLLSECDYGDWAGRPLKELADEPLWRTVQQHPSAARFPGGESMPEMSARAIAAVRRQVESWSASETKNAVVVVVSHGDVIKSVLADALGMHLDAFQRLVVDPASVSVIRYTEARPYVLTVNSTAGDLAWLAPPVAAGSSAAAPSDDAAVGGGVGVQGDGGAASGSHAPTA